MKKLYALTIVALSFSFFACGDDDGFSGNCSCHANAVEFIVGEGQVYLPNVFTPNGDGINDFYLPYAGTDIAEIEEFVIRNGNGEILFSNENFAPNSSQNGWDGQEGTLPYSGQFNFSARIRSADGTVEELSGEFCSFPCSEGTTLSNLGNCRYGTQHSGEGGFNENAPSLESLDCL